MASASPRRRELLAMVGCAFHAVEPRVDEQAVGGADPAGDPGAFVEAVARVKAESVASRFPGRVVIGADTVVVAEGVILGKPRDPGEAVCMLSRLSGRWHAVYTGLAVCGPEAGSAATRHVRTDVRFRELQPAWIERYVKTGEPMDKAGAYGIQGRGSLLVAEIRGCYFNVVGLPLAALSEMLEERGIFLL